MLLKKVDLLSFAVYKGCMNDLWSLSLMKHYYLKALQFLQSADFLM